MSWLRFVVLLAACGGPPEESDSPEAHVCDIVADPAMCWDLLDHCRTLGAMPTADSGPDLRWLAGESAQLGCVVGWQEGRREWRQGET